MSSPDQPHSPPQEPAWSISDLAGEFDISTRTIRFYEEKGLIHPERTSGNQRTYTKRDRARLKLILRGKRFGYSLEEIAEMIGFANVDMREADQIRKSLEYGEKKLAEIDRQVAELNNLRQDILSVKNRMEKRLEELQQKEQA